MRRKRLAIGVSIGVLFLVVSVVLAQVFSAESAERSEITALVQAEARGDLQGVVSRIQSCRTRPACLARATADVQKLARSGSIAILEINTSTSFSLAGGTGTARVAWKAPSSLPIVQCIRVRRTGNALSGLKVELLELSARIPSGNDCPKRY